MAESARPGNVLSSLRTELAEISAAPFHRSKGAREELPREIPESETKKRSLAPAGGEWFPKTTIGVRAGCPSSNKPPCGRKTYWEL